MITSSWRRPQPDVQYIEHTADHAFCNLILTEHEELVSGLVVQSFLERVSVQRRTANLSLGLVTLQKDAGARRHAVPGSPGCATRR